ncbi:MAG: IS3 family transposase [Desulfomonilaceae bacterium]
MECRLRNSVRTLSGWSWRVAYLRPRRRIVFHCHFRTRAEAIKTITEYIAVFYNRQRKQKKLSYLSPAAFERQYYEQQKAA